MTQLGDLDDLDLTTIELEDGTPLLISWQPTGTTDGIWVGRQSLPASAVTVDLDIQRNRLAPAGLYPPLASVQDLVDLFLANGFNSFRTVTDEEPGDPTRARSFLVTDYRRMLGPTELGCNGLLLGLNYGLPGSPAGGFANATTIVGEVRGSDDPANEIGGCIASLQMGRGDDPAPTATFWGSSYTLRGPVDRQPGALMAYTAVVQNYFDGPGSRSLNYGYAAITRPGIGDGADYHVHDPIRNATTFPVDIGFAVCGESGPYPDGGNIGYRIGFKVGGGASPWATAADWRSRIGTGLLVEDWITTGVHVGPPHLDAEPDATHVRLDRRDGQQGNIVECRSEDGKRVLLSVAPDGRVAAAAGREPADLVTRAQLDLACATLAQRLRPVSDVPSTPPPGHDWCRVGEVGGPQYLGSWTGSPDRGLRFRQEAGRGHLDGTLQGGEPGSVAFVLPREMWPDRSAIGSAVSRVGHELGPALVDVDVEGRVTVDHPGGAAVVHVDSSWALGTLDHPSEDHAVVREADTGSYTPDSTSDGRGDRGRGAQEDRDAMRADDVRDLFDDSYADSYDELFIHAEWPKHGADFEEGVLRDNLGTGDRWLDVGCGTGYFLSRFPGVERAGVDISPSMLARARAANPDALFLQEGSFLEPNAPWNGQWDMVSCIWQPYHYVQSIREVETLVDNMTRWTAPGGAVFIPILDLEDIWPFTVVPYSFEPGIWHGTISITGITWTWDQGEGKIHEHSVAPHVEHFVQQLARDFTKVEILRYPPFRPGWVSRKAVLATGRRVEGEARPAEVIRHDIPPYEGPDIEDVDVEGPPGTDTDSTDDLVATAPADPAPEPAGERPGHVEAAPAPDPSDPPAGSAGAAPSDVDLSTTSARRLVAEVAHRASPLRPGLWRSVRHRARHLGSSRR